MDLKLNTPSTCTALIVLLVACGGAGSEAPGSPNPAPTPAGHTLTLSLAGPGTVTSTPAGIDCGADCSESLAQGSSLTLTATPAGGATFIGWSGAGGACSGSGPCTLVVNASQTVSAEFSAAPPSGGTYDCAAANVLCVAQTAGANQEYPTIQLAAAAAKPGDVVLVHAGNYAGFTVSTSGSLAQPIQFIAAGTDVIIGSGGTTENDGVHLRSASHIRIEGFSIRNDAANSPRIHRCIAARGATATQPMRGNVLRNNRCVGAMAEGFYLSQFADGLIEANAISGSGTNGQPRAHGVYLANAGSNATTIRGNTIFGNANVESNGIHANGDISVGGSGLIRGLVVEGNVIHGNGQSGINLDGVQDSRFQNNLIHANARHAIRAYMIDGAGGPTNLHLINNTLVATGGWAVKLSEDGGGHVIFNNLLYGSAGSLSVGSNNLASNNNLVGGSFSNDNEASTIALAIWRARTGQDAASQLGTQGAVFSNAAASDYRLAAGSPARDKGLATFGGIAAPPKDIAGASRIQGPAIDVGAFESAP